MFLSIDKNINITINTIISIFRVYIIIIFITIIFIIIKRVKINITLLRLLEKQNAFPNREFVTKKVDTIQLFVGIKGLVVTVQKKSSYPVFENMNLLFISISCLL